VVDSGCQQGCLVPRVVLIRGENDGPNQKHDTEVPETSSSLPAAPCESEPNSCPAHQVGEFGPRCVSELCHEVYSLIEGSKAAQVIACWCLSSESGSVAETEFIVPKSVGGLTRRKHDALCSPAASRRTRSPVMPRRASEQTDQHRRTANRGKCRAVVKRNRGPSP
jgi:hypothetical protein